MDTSHLGDLAQNKTGIFLIVFGTFVIYIGCHTNYSELKQAGIGILGAGTLAITTQVKNTLVAQKGSTTNIGDGDAS